MDGYGDRACRAGAGRSLCRLRGARSRGLRDTQKQVSQFPVRHCDASSRGGSDPGAAVRSSGLLAPRMLWPLDCFVARAPRNDGWVAADPIASVVIGRRLTPSFCAVSSRSYPATTNSNTVSRRAALAGRCFCARARRRPRSGLGEFTHFACGHASAPATRGHGAGLSEDRTIASLFQKEISPQILVRRLIASSYRPAVGPLG